MIGPVVGEFQPPLETGCPGGGDYLIFVLNAHAPFRGTTMNQNSNLYLMPLCQLDRLGRLSQWPVFNRPTQQTQRTQRAQRAQPVIFVLYKKGTPRFDARVPFRIRETLA